jgi:hypothetical protein
MVIALLEMGCEDVGVLFILHVTIFQTYHFLPILYITTKFLDISTTGTTALATRRESCTARAMSYGYVSLFIKCIGYKVSTGMMAVMKLLERC